MRNLLKTGMLVDKHVELVPIHPDIHKQARSHLSAGDLSPFLRLWISVSNDEIVPHQAFWNRGDAPYSRQLTRRQAQFPWDRGFVDFVY